MTLYAHFRSGCERHHGFKFSAMGAVAAEALNGNVLVPRVLDFWADRVSGMFHPVMTRAAKIDDGRLLGKKLRIGGMGLVTGCAHAGPYRLMLGNGLFLPFDGVGMAGSAENRLGCF